MGVMKTDKRIIIIPDFMIVLKEIEKEDNVTLTDIHLKTKITYCHLSNMKKALIIKDWVSETREGVRKYISLTPRGVDIVNTINELVGKIGIDEEDMIKYRRQGKMKEREELEETSDELEPLKTDDIIKMGDE